MRRIAAAGLGLGLLFGVEWLTAPSMPTFEQVRADYQPSDVRLLDRHGAVLHELRVAADRRRLDWTALADVPPVVRDAILDSEDRRFYAHGGIDWLAGLAVLRGRPRGGSTITMQLAALVRPPAVRMGRGASWWRRGVAKGRQLRLARALERGWRKAEILEAYLNLLPVRGEIEGIGAAAAVLFDKAPHGLTAAEGLAIAALIPAPNASGPQLLARARRLRTRVVPDEPMAGIDAAVARVVDRGDRQGPRIALAPHVARRLLRPNVRTSLPTTLDRAWQEAATDALHRQLLAVRGQQVADGAVLVADNASGDILAYVGSSGPLSAAPAVDGVRARRQPGSALKPFIYGLALAREHLTAASVLDDTPLEVATIGGLYRPRNYDGIYRGPVRLRTALASSLNVPAVRTLLLLGADAVADHLRGLGFAGIDQNGEWYGPGLALGAAEVSLWELVNAYRMLARGGRLGALRLTADPAGPPERLVYPRAVAWLIGDVLADREARALTFGLDNPLAPPFWSAVKTGTSKDMRDNWCLGFTPTVTIGVWVGNASGAAMRDVSGITGAAPVWAELMTLAQSRSPAGAPAAPPELVSASIGSAEGPARREWFLPGTEPRQATSIRAAPRPRIVAPVDATLLAIDPDLPAARQRVAFRARGVTAGARWRLDGLEFGPAAAVALWPPAAGRHRLELVEAGGGRRLDQVWFEVRGGLPLP